MPGYNRLRNKIKAGEPMQNKLNTLSGNLESIVNYQIKTPFIYDGDCLLSATSSCTIYCTQSAHMTVSLPVVRVRTTYAEPLEFVIKDANFSASDFQIRVTSSTTVDTLRIDHAWRALTIKENGGYIHIKWDTVLGEWHTMHCSGVSSSLGVINYMHE